MIFCWDFPLAAASKLVQFKLSCVWPICYFLPGLHLDFTRRQNHLNPNKMLYNIITTLTSVAARFLSFSMTKVTWFYRLAADPPRLLERRFRAGCSQLHRLQWGGWIPLQGQRLLVQLRPQVPRVQLPLHGHPSDGRESGEDHGDMGDPLQRVWGIR